MMKKIFQWALLSEASYADLDSKKIDFTDPEDVKAALIAEGFSPTQASNFVSQWDVKDHQPNTGSGFSATLFERKEGGQPTGQFVLAIRGTEFSLLHPTDIDLRDLVVDAGLAVGLTPQCTGSSLAIYS